MSHDEAEPLAVDDARILALESPVIAGHTLKLVLLEPDAAALDLDALRASVSDRLAQVPRATERVDTSGPEPCWVPATDFDIARHVRCSGSAGGSEAQLWATVSELMGRHLDHAAPLWTFDVIGPLDDGRQAVAVRIHHAMADGISAVRLLDTVLFDPHPDVRPHSGSPGVRPAAPGHGRLAEAEHLPAAVFRELGHRGARTPLDRSIGGARELAFTVASLAEMKAIGGARSPHATVNDVLLAMVAGGLHGWLDAGRRLRAQVPVSLHHRGEAAGAVGNRDSFLNVDLPLAEQDPLVRLDRIAAETRTRKTEGDAEEMYELFHALGRMKRLGRAAQRLAGSAHEFSLSISNVPGPPAPVAIAGRRVQHLFSASEPAAHHALRISAISCAGEMGIGLCTDPQALPGIGGLAEAIAGSYAELRECASVT